MATSTASVGFAAARNRAAMNPLTHTRKRDLMRQQIKYVFILFQENRAFDHYFGTYPGADGLFASFTGADPADATQQPANKNGSSTQVL